MRSTALLLDRDLSLRVGEREVPDPDPDQALIRVEWAGVCGSDLHVLRTGAWVTSWPATLGHEVIGIVESCPGNPVLEGCRVVIDSRVPCGACEVCETTPQLCEQLGWFGEVCPGGFESHVLAPARSLVVCPEGLEAAVGVLAEPCAVAMHAVERAAGGARRGAPAKQDTQEKQAEHAVVVGYGPIGALVHLELTRRWPDMAVTVVEADAGRLELADALGASPLQSLRTLEGPRPQLVVDAAGYPGSLADAEEACARGGTILVVALGHHPVAVTPADLVEHELAIIGSIGFSDELDKAVAVLTADPDRYRPLVTEAVLLDEAPPRLRELLKAPSAGKVVIGPSWT